MNLHRTGNAAPVMQNPGLVHIKTTKNIKEGDEIFLCYRKKYNYFHE